MYCLDFCMLGTHNVVTHSYHDLSGGAFVLLRYTPTHTSYQNPKSLNAAAPICCHAVSSINPLNRAHHFLRPQHQPSAAGFLGQMGPTADGVNTQAESTAQAVKSQAAPAAEAVKSQAQSLAPSSAESVSQGVQPAASSGNIVDSAKAAGEQLQNQLTSSRDLPSIGNVRFHASLDHQACKMSCHKCRLCNIVFADLIPSLLQTSLLLSSPLLLLLLLLLQWLPLLPLLRLLLLLLLLLLV